MKFSAIPDGSFFLDEEGNHFRKINSLHAVAVNYSIAINEGLTFRFLPAESVGLVNEITAKMNVA